MKIHFTKEETITLIVLFFITIISFLIDGFVFSSIDSIRNVALDSIMAIINSPITLSAILITVLINFLVHKKYKLTNILITTILSSVIISNIIKFLIARPRPFGLEKLMPFIGYLDFSFPSGHAFVAFSLLPVLSEKYPKYRILLFTLAILVALTRVYHGLHYFSDIAAGALLGYLLGALILNYKKAKFK